MARQLASAERYAADPDFRERVDARRLHSMRDRPYLEAMSWRVLWTRYRLREADFLRLLAWQGEICPCGEPFDSKPFVDHDHACCPSPFRRGRVVRDHGQRRGPAASAHVASCITSAISDLGVIEANPDVIQPIGWVEKYLATPPYRELRHLCNADGPGESSGPLGRCDAWQDQGMAAGAAVVSQVPDPLPLRTIPVPPEVTAVTGCDCGGLEWHREDCTIWAVPSADMRAAVDAALGREAAFGAELNARLRGAA